MTDAQIMRRFMMLADVGDAGRVCLAVWANRSAAMRWAWLSAWSLACWPAFPPALLVLATSSRRRREEEDDAERYERYGGRQDRQLPAYPYQPPVIVVTGGRLSLPAAGHRPWPAAQGSRRQAPLQAMGGAPYWTNVPLAAAQGSE